MGKLRRLGQYLGLLYADDGSWRIGGVRIGDADRRPAQPISTGPAGKLRRLGQYLGLIRRD